MLGLLNAVPKKDSMNTPAAQENLGLRIPPPPQKTTLYQYHSCQSIPSYLSQSIANPKEQTLEERVHVRGSPNDYKAQTLLLFLAKKTRYWKEGGCKEM